LADDQAERVADRVAVDPPGYRLAIRARAGRDVLASLRDRWLRGGAVQ